VCGCDISNEKVFIEEAKNGNFFAYSLITTAVLVIIIFVFSTYENNDKSKGGIKLLVPETYFINSAGLKLSIERIGNLKIPDEEEKKVVFLNLNNPDINIKISAIKTLILWGNNSKANRQGYIEKINLYLENNNELIDKVKMSIDDLIKEKKISGEYVEFLKKRLKI